MFIDFSMSFMLMSRVLLQTLFIYGDVFHSALASVNNFAWMEPACKLSVGFSYFMSNIS